MELIVAPTRLDNFSVSMWMKRVLAEDLSWVIRVLAAEAPFPRSHGVGQQENQGLDSGDGSIQGIAAKLVGSRFLLYVTSYSEYTFLIKIL